MSINPSTLGSPHPAQALDCGPDPVGYFCNINDPELAKFRALISTKKIAKRKVLFVEGQPAVGVYLLCKGRVKLTTNSSDGKVIIQGVAVPGDVLGLSAVLLEVEHGATAEAMESCIVHCVRAELFVKYLMDHPLAAVAAAKQLSRDYRACRRVISTMDPSVPVVVKLARLFLEWCPPDADENSPIKLTNTFTHEEIAEIIGASRETVTRCLRQLRERGLVTLKGSELLLHDPGRVRLLMARRGGGNGNCDAAHRRP